jgi:hypothetical protein
MDKPTNQGAQNSDKHHSLQTYIRDHTAGAQHAIQLFEALQKAHAGTAFGHFAAEQFHQIQEDLAILENLATDVGAGDFQVKELAGWLADKLSRLKLAPLEKPFHAFEALEFLSLGILGKRALWRTLRSVSCNYPELDAVDLDHLLERAETQYEATEIMRIQMAVRAFGVDIAQPAI